MPLTISDRIRWTSSTCPANRSPQITRPDRASASSTPAARRLPRISSVPVMQYRTRSACRAAAMSAFGPRNRKENARAITDSERGRESPRITSCGMASSNPA